MTTILARCKAQQLKHAAFLTGLPSTGNKADLVATLHQCLAPGATKKPTSRIVSIDMGIRNLAHCVIDVPRTTVDRKPIRVVAWSKLDLLRQQASSQHSERPQVDDPRKVGDEDDVAKSSIVNDSKSAFTPSVLSRTAFKVATMVLRHEPDVILIERQRFRSGGGSAIQEWTIRVNMMESMLWASLETMRHFKRKESFPDLHEVNPQRVAQFWAAADEVMLRPEADLFTAIASNRCVGPSDDRQASSRKMSKKDKVDIVRSWIDGSRNGRDSGPALNQAHLEFDGDARNVAQHFESRKRRVADKDADRIGKLDDLADCLLQAVTWSRWQANREACANLLLSQVG
jgi:cruciform cutting endonuclease 1